MQSHHERPTEPKNRRIKKACNHCRRLKSRCDGQSPCKHCRVYERNCAYDIPSRRPNSLAHHARQLEDRLRIVQSLLKSVNLDLNIDYSQSASALPLSGNPSVHNLRPVPRTASPTILGRRNAEDQGPFRFFSSPTRRSRWAFDIKGSLPCKDTTYKLLFYALDDACILQKFVHEPSLRAMVDLMYETPSGQLEQNYSHPVALIFGALALGSFFASGAPDSQFNDTIAAGHSQEYVSLNSFHTMTSLVAPSSDNVYFRSHYFGLALKLVGTFECHSIVSLQALCFIAIFLQSSGQLERCYSYVGVALRSAVALGLHRSQKEPCDPVECEIRKRVFWTIWRLDTYASSMLGMPSLLSIDDIDQDYPDLFVDDHNAQKTSLTPPPDVSSILDGGNMQIELTKVVPLVMNHRKIFNNARSASTLELNRLMHDSGMFDIEQRLRTWHQNLPRHLISGYQGPAQSERVAQLLRIAFAYIQVLLYEPFLRWVPQRIEAFVDPEVLHYLIIYVTVTRNIVSTGLSIHQTRVVNFSSRSTMITTTYSAIMSLILFLLKIPAPSGTKGAILQEVFLGKGILEGLAPKSGLASEYLEKLKVTMIQFHNMPQPYFDLSSPSPKTSHCGLGPRTPPQRNDSSFMKEAPFYSNSSDFLQNTTQNTTQYFDLYESSTPPLDLNNFDPASTEVTDTDIEYLRSNQLAVGATWYPGHLDPMSIDLPAGDLGASVYWPQSLTTDFENDALFKPPFNPMSSLSCLEDFSNYLPSQSNASMLGPPHELFASQLQWTNNLAEDESSPSDNIFSQNLIA